MRCWRPPDLRNRPLNPAASGYLAIMCLWMSWNECFGLQSFHTADWPVLALLRVAHLMLRITRTTRIARMLRGMVLGMMVLDMALGMARDTATGVGMVRDIGVGAEADLFPVPYRNSNAAVRSLSSSGCSKWSITFPSLELRKGSM